MTFQLPRIAVNIKPEHKPCQLFSLYQKVGRGKYVRMSDNSFSQELAMRVFGPRVLTQSHLSIRPITITCDKVEGITRFPRVHFKPTARKHFGESRQ